MATQRLLRSIAPPASTSRAVAAEALADSDAKQRESAAIAAAKQLASWKPSSDPPPPKQRLPARLSGAVVRESSALLDANALLMQHIRQARARAGAECCARKVAQRGASSQNLAGSPSHAPVLVSATIIWLPRL